jgi:RND family efflux transporter MFP subunit
MQRVGSAGRIAATLLLAACATTTPADEPSPAPSVPVDLAAVRRETVEQPVVGTGTYGSRDELALAFKVGGVVARVLVDEGDAISRGQPLALLDLREIDALRTKAQVARDKAERDAARLRTLFADSVVTRAQLQDAESALAAAAADLAAATVNREYAVITAPGDGRVLRRQVQPGQLVAPGQEVLRVANDTRGRVVRLGLPERDALRLRERDQAIVTFDAQPERAYTGRVVLRGAATDPRTGTVPVEVEVGGADAMPSGAVARVRIRVTARAVATLVPVEALVEADGDSATVFTARDGRAVRRRVRVGALAGTHVAVDGLGDADSVITSGAAYLTDSVTVRRVEGVR